ncbi:RHS repeat-associated core domain-containing protein [Porticoccus sp. W117]|uniref:RHS repeat domain-containing protein n=1 Tax=Porticoccus sp. W117 TaxID=3054777 RepID=UPI0025938C98|nr:RHS repeat-associated core domain-containing protein [Porticoccus sp. W117]MDM3871234.1 RHS repeat-associated core domain-containing protein [Porticoccus sp. W117]
MSEADLIAFTKRTTPVTSNSGLFDLRQRFTRGFTGHEMLDEVGIIHMNGRIYDPHLARFVQADPIVQSPFNTQSLNRYSYIWNNPLNGIDPSGFTGERFSEDNSSGGGDSGFTFSFSFNFSSSDSLGFARVRPAPGINDASFGNVSSGLAGGDSNSGAVGLPELSHLQFRNASFAAQTRGLGLTSTGEIAAFFEILQEERIAHGLSTDDVMLAENGAAIVEASIDILSAAPGASEVVRLASGASRLVVRRLLLENYQNYVKKRIRERLQLLRFAPLKFPKNLKNLQSKFDELAQAHLLPQFRKLDPDLKSGITGSFKTGLVGNKRKERFGLPIDLNDFDIDFFIKSDILFKKYGSNLRANPEFRKILSNTPGFEGLRPNKKGFSIKFQPSSQ